MRIVVSDTSCMIDLRKAALLEELLRLPFTFVMPNTLFDDEWLSLEAAEKAKLRELGLEVHDLRPELVERAVQVFNQHRRLKLNDCFALVLAEDVDDGVLLTGDGLLRRVAEEREVEARGVLWVTDELEARNLLPVDRLLGALRILQEDELVFLPEDELARRIRRLTQL